MRRQIAARQNAAVNFRMECFDPTVEHFRKARVVRNLGHGDAAVAQEFRRAASRQQLNAGSGETSRKLDESRLVGHAQQRSFDD